MKFPLIYTYRNHFSAVCAEKKNCSLCNAVGIFFKYFYFEVLIDHFMLLSRIDNFCKYIKYIFFALYVAWGGKNGCQFNVWNRWHKLLAHEVLAKRIKIYIELFG